MCIQQWAKTNKKTTCAECKKDYSRRKLEKDFLASKMVDDLQVKCSHPSCDWQGINSCLKKHQRVCDYREKKNFKETSENECVVIDEAEDDC